MSEEIERLAPDLPDADLERADHANETDNDLSRRHLSASSARAHTFPRLSTDQQERLYEFCGRVGLFGDNDFDDKQQLQREFRKRIRSGILRGFRRQRCKLVYELACEGYEWARLWYFTSRFVIIGSLVLQIGVAGAITVMGAYGHFMIPVTVLGAINAALAALLALMKGMDLTQSTYRTMNELEAVIDFINRTVKEFEYGGRVEIEEMGVCKKVDLNAFQQAQIAWAMYNDAIKNKQKNHHDPELGGMEVSEASNKKIGITMEQSRVGKVQIRHSGRKRNTWFSQIDW